jgi:CheY-like chemotaxis protein
LVEDDDNDVFFFQRAVQQVGLSNPVHVARDGLQAVDYLSGAAPFDDRSRFPFPSVIFLDLNLPRKHGLEVLKWIRQNPEWKTLPVIVLTSSGSELDVTVSYRLGANSFFVKPTDPDQLTELLKVVIQHWFKWNEMPPALPEKRFPNADQGTHG